MSSKLASVVVLCGVVLAACTQGPEPTAAVSNSPQGAPSGITADNGGGQRQLGDIPNVGFSPSGVTIGNVPASRGAAY